MIFISDNYIKKIKKIQIKAKTKANKIKLDNKNKNNINISNMIINKGLIKEISIKILNFWNF